MYRRYWTERKYINGVGTDEYRKIDELYDNETYGSYSDCMSGTPTPPTPGDTSLEYVDLGLPSGLLWATCNVGATKPEDFGLYFRWGNVNGYYQNQLDEFVADEYYKLGDTLNSDEDAAHVHMGGKWRLPTIDEFHELFRKTDIRTESLNGVLGIRCYNPTDNTKSIFFPYCGHIIRNQLIRYEYYYGGYYIGYYWTSSVGYEPEAYVITERSTGNTSESRSRGDAVRGVREP